MENHQLGANTPIASLTFLKNISDMEQYCAICLNDICSGDAYRKLSECGHAFHCKCIDAWLVSHSTCPLCRAQLQHMISLNQDHYEWSDFVSNFLLLIQDFLHKMCNPLNQELSSMLCGNISCIS